MVDVINYAKDLLIESITECHVEKRNCTCYETNRIVAVV